MTQKVTRKFNLFFAHLFSDVGIKVNMSYFLKLPALLLLGCILCDIHAQTDDIGQDLEDIADHESLSERYPDWTIECLESELLEQVQEYLLAYGPLYDWEELFRIEGIKPRHVECLYSSFGDHIQMRHSTTSSLRVRIRHDVRPISGSVKMGVDQYGRMEGTIKNIHLFYQWENDRNEWKSTKSNLFDFDSGHIQIYNRKQNLMVILGDYSLSHGQGLLAYHGLFASPSAGMGNLIRSSGKISGYRSKTESGFYRGLAFTRTFTKARGLKDFSFWSSISPLDANLKIHENKTYWQSIDLSGDHGSVSAQQRKGSLTWSSIGARAELQLINWNFDILYRRDIFDHPFDPIPGNGSFRSGLPSFRTRNSYSISNSGQWGTVTSWGEWAIQEMGGRAWLQGLSLPVASDWNLGLIIRHANKRFYTPFGGAFFKRNPPRNEWGWHLMTEGKLTPGIRILSYWNVWFFPGIRYLHDRPDHGMRWFISLNHTKKRAYTFSFQTLIDRDAVRIDRLVEDQFSGIKEIMRIRIHYEHLLGKDGRISGRVEMSGDRKSNFRNFGSLAYGDIVYKPLGKRFRLAARLTWTQIPDYDLRISAFENDILGRFRIAAFSENAFHSSISFRFDLLRALKVDLHTRAVFSNSQVSSTPIWNHSIQVQYTIQKE
jgi:hypothetical protein